MGTVSAGSIQFVSATPQILGIKGSGQSETSVIQFLVIDVNGNPVDGALVNFVITGPNGGEFIGDIDSTPTTASAVTISGIASVLLHSGTIAGPVNITATTTISNGPIFSSATPLSIGGGVPSATHFSLGRTMIGNLEGFDIINLQSIVDAYVADRFGNYNVLKGTSFSFYTEAGAIDRQGITGEDINNLCHGPDPDPKCNAGAAGALFRTQNPMPQDVPPALAGEALSIYFGGNEPFRVDQLGITHNPKRTAGLLSLQLRRVRKRSLMRTMTDCLPVPTKMINAPIAMMLSASAMEGSSAGMPDLFCKVKNAPTPGSPVE